MLKDEVGKNDRVDLESHSVGRLPATRGAARVLVVDAVLGSRFALTEAASGPGLIVDAASGVEAAWERLSGHDYDVVIADHQLGGISGFDFLSALHRNHGDTALILVAGSVPGVPSAVSIRKAGISLVLKKPWRAETLRRSLESLIADKSLYRTWREVRPVAATGRGVRHEVESSARRRRDVALHGMLAGLNSCESEEDVYRLLHDEISGLFRVTGWIWACGASESLVAIDCDGGIEAISDHEMLDERLRLGLEEAGRHHGVSRLDEGMNRRRAVGATVLVGWNFDLPGTSGIAISGLAKVEPSDAAALCSLLREMAGGLRLALERILAAQDRSRVASDLARRVSEELRMPIGALSHAIDRLRGEALRLGLSSEWVDRVRSESERVARAVEHLEGQMVPERHASSARADG